jgi:hypothetical protein
MSCHPGVFIEGVDFEETHWQEQWLRLCRTEAQSARLHKWKVQKAGLNGVCG